MDSPFASYRTLFPHLQTGKLWLNHAAIGPLSLRTKDAVDRYVMNRHTGTIDDFPHIVQLSNEAKDAIGSLINAPRDRIGFVYNTSEGLNILANGLSWKSGDRILLNDLEFPTNIVPFLNLRRHGVEIDIIRTKNGELPVEAIAAAITPRTRLLSVSFVQFLSGFRADLSAIGTLCRDRGVLFSVDAIQGVGSTPLDVQETKIDFLSCGGHKWLMAMMGLGFVYVTKEMQERITQMHAGWTSNRDYFSRLFDYRLDLDDSARRYENGAQNHAGIAALGASAQLLQEAGIPRIHDHLLALTDRVISFADSHGYELATPRERSTRTGIVTLNVPQAERVFEKLNAQQIILSLREGMLRISPHFYNTAEEIDRACAAIKDAA